MSDQVEFAGVEITGWLDERANLEDVEFAPPSITVGSAQTVSLDATGFRVVQV